MKKITARKKKIHEGKNRAEGKKKTTITQIKKKSMKVRIEKKIQYV